MERAELLIFLENNKSDHQPYSDKHYDTDPVYQEMVSSTLETLRSTAPGERRDLSTAIGHNLYVGRTPSASYSYTQIAYFISDILLQVLSSEEQPSKRINTP